MNHKDLITNIASKMNTPKEEVLELMDSFLEQFTAQLKEDKSIAFRGFGSFEVVKREERISVNPQSKQRSLIPPKLVLSFKQSPTLKEKINSKL